MDQSNILAIIMHIYIYFLPFGVVGVSASAGGVAFDLPFGASSRLSFVLCDGRTRVARVVRPPVSTSRSKRCPDRERVN